MPKYSVIASARWGFVQWIMLGAVVLLVVSKVFGFDNIPSQETRPILLSPPPDEGLAPELDVVPISDDEFDRYTALVGTMVFYDGKDRLVIGLISDSSNPCVALLNDSIKVNCEELQSQEVDDSKTGNNENIINR
jgi:hypothetical protein